MTRPGDVRGMRRWEINFEKAVWRIPAERMKMREKIAIGKRDDFRSSENGVHSGRNDPHGFRSTASTILNERGFHPDVIEAALAHQDENEIRRVYNRAAYWPERVKLLQACADLIDEFKRPSVGNSRAA
jgi:integrase